MKYVNFMGFKVCLALLLITSATYSQERPKLVVGIVVDQMRWDYLSRYYDRYETGGFKRLLGEGFSCENTFITHLPSVTAVGHSTIYTGSVPAIHGIVGNNWVDQSTGKKWYCTEDTLELTVGSRSDAGQMSPRNLLASTITDELALATNFRSKIVGVSIKDRAAILPAGHTPTGSFWLDNASENFITSTYYMKELPEWVKQFNNRKVGRNLIKNGWNTLYPLNSYVQSTEDNVPWEGTLGGESAPVFPHDIKKFYDANPDIIRKTPFGNSLTFEFAKAAIKGYDMSNGPATNFLTINCASTDYVGHNYGPNSVEIEDVYLRLDRDLATFFKYLDETVGKKNYTLFLTADHGAAHNSMFLEEHRMIGGRLNYKNAFLKDLDKYLENKYNVKGLITNASSPFVTLNHKLIQNKNLNYDELKKDILTRMKTQEGIQFVADMENIGDASIPQLIKEKLINGYNSKRCGVIALIPEPGWGPNGLTGTGHSLWNAFDTHIPLLFMGWGVKPGKSYEFHSMCDIAPTIASLLHIQTPNGTIGKTIHDLIEK